MFGFRYLIYKKKILNAAGAARAVAFLDAKFRIFGHPLFKIISSITERIRLSFKKARAKL